MYVLCTYLQHTRQHTSVLSSTSAALAWLLQAALLPPARCITASTLHSIHHASPKLGPRQPKTPSTAASILELSCLHCRDEDPASRKRPYDGSAPNSRQEAAAAAAAAAGGVGMPIKGPTPHMMMQPRPAGQPLPAVIPGMRTAHPGTQIPLTRALPGVPAALAAGQQQHPGLPPGLQQLHGLSQHNIMLQTALARVNGLPPQQRQQALQMQLHALQQGHLHGQAMVAGIPGQHQVPGMQPNQGLPAGQQLQGMAGLRAQGMPHQGFPQQALQQQGLTQQGLQQQGLQQQGLQQQGLRLPGMPGAMPAAGVQQATALQGLMPQALMQQQRIPQGDGSADLPPSIAEVAAAAGMQPEQLRAILPPRIAAIMDRGSVDSSALGSMQGSSTGPAQAGAAGGVAAAAAAAAAGVTGRGRASPGSTLQQRRRQRRVIPQVDGEGDEEDYGDDEEDDGACSAHIVLWGSGWGHHACIGCGCVCDGGGGGGGGGGGVSCNALS